MTDADWLTYCLTAAAVILAIIAIAILFQHYPIEEAINATYLIMVNSP